MSTPYDTGSGGILADRVVITDGSGTPLTAPSSATTAAYAASLVVKASAGTLLGFSGYNSHTATVFIQVHDSASLPADTAVPKIVLAVPPTSNFSYDAGQWGRPFTTGIVICNSTTGPTKTIGGSTTWVDAQYI